MAKRPRILCISLGSIGKRHLRNTRSLLPKAEIAVYRQHTKGDGVVPEGGDAVLHSMEEALAFSPEAVIISSPASEHVANALPFLQKDIPVFLEKPLAASAKGIESLEQAAKKAKGFVMVGYVLRFLPALHTIKALLKDNVLGRIYTARVEVGQYLPDWRPQSDYREGVSAQKKLGGGALLELSHELDYATWLFGFPQTVQCSRGHLSALEIDVEDSAHVLLEYADKHILVKLDLLQRVATMAVQLVGEKGTLEADLIKEKLTLITPEAPEGKPIASEVLPNGNDIYLRQFDLFFHKALPGYTPSYKHTSTFGDHADVASAAEVLRLVDLAKRASDEGKRQKVNRSDQSSEFSIQ